MASDTRPVAVVTASASGIGRETARALARDGYRVIVSDVDVERGEATAAELKAEFRACDVRKADQIEALFAGLGTIAVLVNNAGIAGPTAALTEIDLATWNDSININLTAMFLTCRIAVPGMVTAGKGTIVNMSSVAGKIGYPNRSPYCATKWGVLGLTASLAREVGRHGVHRQRHPARRRARRPHRAGDRGACTGGEYRHRRGRALLSRPPGDRGLYRTAGDRGNDILSVHAGGALDHRAVHRRQWRV